MRTHYCGEINESLIDQEVTVCGWAHRRRDHGGVIFIDLRDRYGLTQVTFDPDANKEAWKIADKLRGEWVILVKGKVIERPRDMVNKKMATGEIEVEISEIEILNESKTPPFEIGDEKSKEANENLRLKYRFVDLRRDKLQKIIKNRNEVIRYIREYFHKNSFITFKLTVIRLT